jgi:MFS family permease
MTGAGAIRPHDDRGEGMTDARTSRRPAGLVLFLLLLVYILNFLDRQILGILGPPIRAELHLTDTQFGAIGGLAFATLYSVLGVPLAMLADRTTRSGVITGALVVWSGFTALCGLATGFWQLFAFRLGVGVGEAGGAAPSYALVADYFPPAKRSRALAIYSLGVPLGGACGVVFGAYLAQLINWRTAFLTVGLLGIVRDIPRPVPAASTPKMPVASVFPVLLAKPAFWLLAFSAGCSSLCGYGLSLWVPSVLVRSYGLELIETGQFMGSLLLIGGTVGVFAGGWFADRLGHVDRAWYARLPAIAWAITVPTFAIGLLSPSPWVAWPLLLIPNALNILWLGPVTTAVQHLVPAPMRATAGGSFLLINNFLGLGIGPLLMGTISDHLKAGYGTESLRYAAVSCLVFYAIAAVLVLFAIPSLRRDWVEDAA